jgi:hypothetical protein
MYCNEAKPFSKYVPSNFAYLIDCNINLFQISAAVKLYTLKKLHTMLEIIYLRTYYENEGFAVARSSHTL